MFGWRRPKRRKLHPDVQKLSVLLRAIEALLSDAEDDWATEVARCAEIIERSDAYGLDRFLKLYGGMGSINDVVLHRNGSPLVVDNTELHSLLNKAYELAHRLKRDAP